MDLKTFITQTLAQILEGIKEAQDALRDLLRLGSQPTGGVRWRRGVIGEAGALRDRHPGRRQ